MSEKLYGLDQFYTGDFAPILTSVYTMTKHYRSIRERKGEGVKEGKFVYSFVPMDLT